jgi:hypothetical protein
MGSDHAGRDLGPDVAETHSGVVFFLGDRAYKVKKPVDLGFLDFTTLSARQAMCHREVELNRRLAPDVYLGVSDVLDPSGAVCEHLVTMRRMPADRRLATLARSGAPLEQELEQLARLMARFHAAADRSEAADRAAGVDALAGRWATNAAEMAAYCPEVLAADDVTATEALARRYLEGRRALIEERIAHGRACDGHGDLLADDIFCLDDGPRVLDCMEFDDALRYEDGLADVAFLAMDLERLGRPELAERFLAAYQEHADDTWPASLAHHHIAYRSQVRAKVSAIRAAQGHEPSAEKARQLLGLCRRHLDASRIRLVVVGGLPGTGKSSLAAAVGERLGAVVLRSDEIRKELAGLASDEPAPAAFGEGLYDAARTAATYRELLDRAGVALRYGETVVLDASWTDAAHRSAAREVAARTSSDLVELRRTAPPEVAAARLRARAERGGDPSDADPAIAAAMAAVEAPWPEAAVIDSAPTREEAVDRALQVITSH